MFRGLVLVGFRRLFSTRSQDRSSQWTGAVHDDLVRNARFPRNDRRASIALDGEDGLELRATVASVVSAEPRARDARDAQDAMTKSPSEEEKSETVRARVADEATMVAMPVIVRAARTAASLHAQDRIANDEDAVVALLLSATFALTPRPAFATLTTTPPRRCPRRPTRRVAASLPRSPCARFSSPWTVLLRGSSWWTGCVVSRSSPTSSARPSFLKTDARRRRHSLTHPPPPPSPQALKNFCREGDQINLLHVIPKCVSSNLSLPFRASPLFSPSARPSHPA